MRHRLLGILPLPAPVDKGDKEEGPPEDEVGHLCIYCYDVFTFILFINLDGE